VPLLDSEGPRIPADFSTVVSTSCGGVPSVDSAETGISADFSTAVPASCEGMLVPLEDSDGIGISAGCSTAVQTSCGGVPSVDTAGTGIPAEVSVLEDLQKSSKQQLDVHLCDNVV